MFKVGFLFNLNFKKDDLKMKKTILLAGIAGLLSFNANAQDSDIQNQTKSWNIHPVIGLDFSNLIGDLESEAYENHLMNLGFSAGLQFNRYFGIEAFYQHTLVKGEKDYYGLKTENELNYYGIDFAGYIPLNKNFDFISTVGMGKYEVNVDYSYGGYTLSDSDDGMGIRFGLGLQHKPDNNDKVSTRFMVRYNDIDIDGINYVVDLSLGLRYHFQ
ncbi:MAG: porin family protein [Alphaproteobacteria bacterium]|nr:porin family protein [Alphaproteobacteria bacterium]